MSFQSRNLARKAVTAALGLSMTLGMIAGATPALAAGSGKGTSTTGSILITQAISHPASAYQVFDGDVEEDGSIADITWGTGVNGEALLAELAGTSEFAGCATAREVAEKLNVIHYNSTTHRWEPTVAATQTDSGTSSKDTALAKKFAEIVSKHLKSTGAKAFDDTTTPEVTNLDDGWYVVAPDYSVAQAEGASLLFPGLITVGKSQSRVTPKESAPTLTKKVKEDSNGAWVDYADFEIGQTINYKLEATIGDEDLKYYSSYYLKFTDTLSSGLDCDVQSVKVTIDNVDKTGQFTVNYANHVLTVEKADVLSLINAGSKVVVTYDATLNSSADTGTPGNNNTAVLTFSNDPRSEFSTTNKTPEDPADVYTYRLSVTKTDSADSSLKLAGAKFGVKRADGKWAILATSSTGGSKDVATNNNVGNSTVYVTGWADTMAGAGLVTTDSSGIANIIGLDDDAYQLVEVVAPDGYDLDSTAKDFEIIANVDGNNAALASLKVRTATGDANGTLTTGSVAMTISDVKSPILPTTGLAGIITSVVLGGGLASGAALVVSRQLRKDGEDAQE